MPDAYNNRLPKMLPKRRTFGKRNDGGKPKIKIINFD